ncbi:hypothetical protein HYT45_00610 [Candidatus Uhrbacteria bacterium]|nr:hypothetical protein [Candidatus Uhrbacteria bacterium]
MEPIKPPLTPSAPSAQAISEPEIKTMPERFIGAPLKAPPKPVEKVVVVEKVIEKKVLPPAPLPVGLKKAGFPKWAIAAILLLIIGGGAGLWYAVSLTPAKLVAVTPPPPPAPLPRCSDGLDNDGDGLIDNADQGCENPSDNDETNLPPPPPPPSGPKAGADSDADGLTDEEEKVYGSNFQNSDSDGDGFIDGVELFHLYNPAGLAPVRLIDTGSVTLFKDRLERYQIYFPKPWSAVEAPDSKTAAFHSLGEDAMEVLVEENINRLPITNWYLERNPGVKPAELETFITKSNLDGVKSPDRLTAYISANSSVYVITYRLGADETINFRKTFEMMLNSFTRLR